HNGRLRIPEYAMAADCRWRVVSDDSVMRFKAHQFAEFDNSLYPPARIRPNSSPPCHTPPRLVTVSFASIAPEAEPAPRLKCLRGTCHETEICDPGCECGRDDPVRRRAGG